MATSLKILKAIGVILMIALGLYSSFGSSSSSSDPHGCEATGYWMGC